MPAFHQGSGLHVAIIMDGNGRWARQRNLPRAAGHQAGAEALRHIVEAAPDTGIRTLTVYAFSSDNWKRPAEEVSALMALLGLYLRQETPGLRADGVRLTVIGRRDRLSASLLEAIDAAEAATAEGVRVWLRLAIDYSARHAILAAAENSTQAGFEQTLSEAPAVDALIRTGGEQRLSDFLLWESAYAELIFTETMWPDFGPNDLRRALAEFHRRERRFGELPAMPPVPQTRERWLR